MPPKTSSPSRRQGGAKEKKERSSSSKQQQQGSQVRPLELQHWIAKARDGGYWVTVGSLRQAVQDSPEGSVEVLCLDRNVEDLTSGKEHNPPKKPLDPRVFFRHGYHLTFTPKNPESRDITKGLLTGEVDFWTEQRNAKTGKWEQDSLGNQNCECGEDEDDVPTTRSKTRMRKPGCFRLDVYHREDDGKVYWCPAQESKSRTYQDDTPVGWRGPMILMSDLPALRKVYWDDSTWDDSNNP